MKRKFNMLVALTVMLSTSVGSAGKLSDFRDAVGQTGCESIRKVAVRLEKSPVPKNITITFNYPGGSEALKAYATERISKLQKFLNKPMTAQIKLSLEGSDHVANVNIVSGIAHFQVTERTKDMHESIALAADKLERQIRGGVGHPRK